MSDTPYSDFETLGITPQFPLPSETLQAAYRGMQQRWHPDLFVQTEENIQLNALHQSSLINDAYRRLKDPIHCAEAFFRTQFEATLLDRTQGSHAFMIQILTLGEAIETAFAASDQQKLDELTHQIHHLSKTLHQTLVHCFEQGDAVLAAETIAHLKYLMRCQQMLVDRLSGSHSAL